jgi:SAM-dependent methyltransferase
MKYTIPKMFKMLLKYFSFIQKKIKLIILKNIFGWQYFTNKNYDSEFDKLQKIFPFLPEYGYDEYSTWNRAAHRTIEILKLVDIKKMGCKILDAACGDGMLGVLFNSYGHSTILVDQEDWRDPRAKSLPFFQQNIAHLDLLDSNQFDLVCSFNTFEHLIEPLACFNELLRLCKPGGYIFLEFGPLFNGPWGLHAYRTLKMPYPQYLFSEKLIENKLSMLGIYDLGVKKDKLQPLNKWRYADFVSLWNNNSAVEVINQIRLINDEYLDVILQYPCAFSGKNVDLIDLTTQGIKVILKKL